MHKRRTWYPWAAALLLVALVAGAAGALARPEGVRANGGEPTRAQRRAGPESRPEPPGPATMGPIIGPTSWYDALDDASGLSWLERTQLLTDRVRLSLVEVLGGDVDSVRAMTEGPGGVLYLGTDESRLWSYDPATDTTTDLGMPVPDECDN